MSGYWFCPNATSSCSSCLWLKVVRWRLLAGEGYALLRLLNPTATEVSHNVPFLTDSPISVFRGEKRKGEGVAWILFFCFFVFLGKNFPGLISSLPQHDTRNAALTEKAAIHQWLSQKKEGLPDFLVPTGIRQPESQRALAGKHKLVRNRHQKLEDLSKIITTITSKGTHLLKMSRLGLLVSDDIIKQLDVEWQRQLLWLHEQTW